MISLIRFEPHPDQQGMTDYWKLIPFEGIRLPSKSFFLLFGQNTIANKVQYSQVKKSINAMKLSKLKS